jgi:GT2 family glycosyltransferase/glycosyltransferase involved in cell wall biosynthesis
MTHAQRPTLLAAGNAALRESDWARAMGHFVEAWLQDPAVAALAAGNMRLARRRRAARNEGAASAAGVFCWDLGHNAAGRAQTLLRLHERLGPARLLGCLYGPEAQTWRPLRMMAGQQATVLRFSDGMSFVEEALRFVAANPLDLVHLSKPRLPGLIVGATYKLLWGSTVLLDVDDDELAFTATGPHADVRGELADRSFEDLSGTAATEIAVRLAACFDRLTTVNGELQRRFGGDFLPHARMRQDAVPDDGTVQAVRASYGLSADKKLVLFLGTPRRHKGVLPAAQILAAMRRDDVQFVVVGSFDDDGLRSELLAVRGLDLVLIEDQPLDCIDTLTQCASCCVALQDPASPIALAQTPAKISDALAAGVPVAVTDVPPLRELVLSRAALTLDIANDAGIAAAKLGRLLDGLPVDGYDRDAAARYFHSELSLDVNVERLRRVVQRARTHSTTDASRLVDDLLLRLPRLEALGAAVAEKSAQWPGGPLHAIDSDAPWDDRAALRQTLAPTMPVSSDAASAPPRRVVVYTANTGSYDQLADPPFVVPGWDYVAFSDVPPGRPGIWQVRPIDYHENDPTRIARFIKLHPHLFFPDKDISIWVDANIGFAASPDAFVEALAEDGYFALFPHPQRDCLYAEAEACVMLSKDQPEEIDAQLDRYLAAGFPRHAGMWETGVLVRRHNDVRCRRLMNAWWRELFIGSRRDQLALPVALASTGAQAVALARPGVDLRQHPVISYVRHPARKKVADAGEAWPPGDLAPQWACEGIGVDIGLCVHDASEASRHGLEAALSTRGPADRLILVDDASTGDITDTLLHVAANEDGTLLIRSTWRNGQAWAFDEILRASSRPYVLLLSAGAVLSAGALRRMVRCAESNAAIAVVGPMSNTAGLQSIPMSSAEDGHLDVGAALASLCGRAPVRPALVALVDGFCCLVRRAAFECVGLLDEATFAQGIGAVEDFCLRAADFGWLSAIAPDAYVARAAAAPVADHWTEAAKALRRKHGALRLERSLSVGQRHPGLARLSADATAERQRRAS